jgi:hypothetical protein
MADVQANFSYSTVATAPSPASSGTSLVVAAGNGVLFPTAPFNAVVWPSGAQPLSTNSEIVRVTAISTDTLTIVRQQEGTSARTILVGDQIAAAITARWLNALAYPVPLIIASGVVYEVNNNTQVDYGVQLYIQAGGVLYTQGTGVLRWVT